MAELQYDDIVKYFKKPEGPIGTIIAEHMDEEYAALNKWAVQKMGFQKTDKVLEIGFGTGLAIHQMSEIITQGFITGIDFSELMVQQASNRNAAAIDQGRVLLQKGDIQSLPEFGHQFDKILAVNNMMYWENPTSTLQHLARHLKPTGCLSVFWMRSSEYISSQKGQNELKWYIQTLRSAGYTSIVFVEPDLQLYRCIETVDTTLDQVRYCNPFSVNGICIQAYKVPPCTDLMSFCKGLLDITKIATNMVLQYHRQKRKGYVVADSPRFSAA